MTLLLGAAGLLLAPLFTVALSGRVPCGGRVAFTPPLVRELLSGRTLAFELPLVAASGLVAFTPPFFRELLSGRTLAFVLPLVAASGRVVFTLLFFRELLSGLVLAFVLPLVAASDRAACPLAVTDEPRVSSLRSALP